MTESNIVELRRFIQATRDAGYRDLVSALAELIDNSLDADATRIDITLVGTAEKGIQVQVRDDGHGMRPKVLACALQFGGTTRFDSRNGFGRYGMGLPNSSLSQARRVDVYSWTRRGVIWHVHLDVDEILSNGETTLAYPARIRSSSFEQAETASGTKVVWSKCDRIEFESLSRNVTKIRKALGRMYRKAIKNGRRLVVNGLDVIAFDPLFLDETEPLSGSVPLGPPILYRVKNVDSEGRIRQGLVTVRFSQLPIEDWHNLPARTKRAVGISKGAGISIVRAGREIDFGWFFVGDKRKENYDDWWRCEIEFDAELDGAFGVTNTKQGIRPTEFISSILSPDIEQIAHRLNRNVRERFAKLQASTQTSLATRQAERRDVFIAPPQGDLNPATVSVNFELEKDRGCPVGGLRYRLIPAKVQERSFFVPVMDSAEIVVYINKDHPFFEDFYLPLMRSRNESDRELFRKTELLILAAARAECLVAQSGNGPTLRRMREEWGSTFARFLI